jgi:hypothetical protein
MRTDLALLATVVCWLLFGLDPVAALAQAQGQNAFSAHDASALLNKMNDALVNRSAGRFLSAFNLSRMENSQLFKQQITSFIAHTDSIRMHFNLTSARMNGDHGDATVDVQMEADTGNGGTPLHKEATLSFVAANAGSGWKFTDVQPRSFFSLSSASSANPSPSQ